MSVPNGKFGSPSCTKIILSSYLPNLVSDRSSRSTPGWGSISSLLWDAVPDSYENGPPSISISSQLCFDAFTACLLLTPSAKKDGHHGIFVIHHTDIY